MATQAWRSSESLQRKHGGCSPGLALPATWAGPMSQIMAAGHAQGRRQEREAAPALPAAHSGLVATVAWLGGTWLGTKQLHRACKHMDTHCIVSLQIA